jgi:putative ATP-binding cassette transporter
MANPTTIERPQRQSRQTKDEAPPKPSLDDLPDREDLSEEDRQELEAFASGEKERLRKKYLVRRFWRAARGFWSRDRGDRLRWVLVIGLVAVIAGYVAAQYGINIWNRSIFDGLQQHDRARVLMLSASFFPLAAATLLCSMANVIVRMGAQRRWRAWLSDAIISRWLKNGHSYQLNLVSGDHDNPESRLTEDLRISTEAPIDFTVGVLQAGLSPLPVQRRNPASLARARRAGAVRGVPGRRDRVAPDPDNGGAAGMVGGMTGAELRDLRGPSAHGPHWSLPAERMKAGSAFITPLFALQEQS